MKKQINLTINLSAIILLLTSSLAYSQESVVYVCPYETTFGFTSATNSVIKSDGVCSSGSEVRHFLTGDAALVQSIDVVRQGNGDANRPFRVDINWNAGEGTIILDVEFRRMNYEGVFSGCDWKPWTNIGTLIIHKENRSPGGILVGETSITKSDDTPTNISLNYQKDASYPYDVQFVRYSVNGAYYGVVSPQNGTITLPANNLPFGSYEFTAEAMNNCLVWFPVTSNTVQILPSCSQDNPNNISVELTGNSFEDFLPQGLRIDRDKQYSVSVTGVSDLANHYDIDFGNVASDFTFSGNSFTALKEVGSYEVNFKKKVGRESCPNIPVLKIFLSGKDELVEDDCPIVLPDGLATLGFNVDAESIVLEHFAATVQSKSYIEVMPGVTLDYGAELVLLPGTPSLLNDLTFNFIEQKAFDEFGRIAGATRVYFDDQGRATQSQSKNLEGGVILTSATLYDAYSRPAINTLAAPTDTRQATDGRPKCNELADQGLDFSFVHGFVKHEENVSYSHLNFDLAKEESPDAVYNGQAGTLGWYYSTNNGTATGDLLGLNEPLVAATSYPYSRTLFHHDGSGDVKAATKPGDVFRAGLGHVANSNTEPVLDTDPYLTDYLNMYDEVLTRPTTLSGQFFRAVSFDEVGKKSVTYSDKAGNAIISLYFGEQATPITRSYNIYNNAGRLIVSVSPNGVAQFNNTAPTNFGSIDKTTYKYNHKGWLLEMTETDAGTTRYVYRKDGKIRFSQNAEQINTSKYSYTNYDRSGRPVESGEYEPTSNGIQFSSSEMQNILENITAIGGLPDNVGTKHDRVFTYYDEPDTEIPMQRTQRFVQGAVSRSSNANTTTWYSYDERGRVEWMVQKIAALGTDGIKTIDYRYGYTGAVQDVVYQKDAPAERFAHFYEYDLDGRLERIYTATNILLYNVRGELNNRTDLTLQANYSYYLHGPLKRVEYPKAKQGIDYVYTAYGALKGINDADPLNDPGKDGEGTSEFGLDVFGMTLDYYSGDYLSNEHAASISIYPSGTVDQFTGLIKGYQWHSPVSNHAQQGYAYRYDARNQMQDARWAKSIPEVVNPYLESIGGYDLNGNINTLNRKNELGVDIADFKYNYSGNKLDNITQGNTTTHVRNYTYNDIGQMTEQEDVEADKKLKTQYDVTGKVTVVHDQDDKLITTYAYDDRGFRLSKTGYDVNGDVKDKTWYVRDASGNLVSTYEQKVATAGGALSAAVPTEMPVYGSGKIGLYKPEYGLTFYELTDHLGNVRALIGDTVTVEYMATMETERVDKEQDFVGINSAPSSQYINHTPGSVTVDGETTTIADPNEVIRINNAQDVPKKPVGGGILLWVHPGDKVSTEVYAKYANFDGNNTTSITGLASYLALTFGAGTSIIDGVNIFSGLDQTPAGVFSPLNNVDDNLPKAFLSYIVFDKNMVPIAFNYDQVSTDAEMTAANAGILTHEHLMLQDIEIEKEGFIYIYVSNQSDQNMDVYFDDLKVTHQYSEIVAGGDFYPFGLEMKDRQITREQYRFGYQGQFAEKDDETGWNHFELREYDPVIGRWLSKDPMAQYFSPYVGMGNNPVNGTDPTGGETKSPIYGINGKFLGVDSEGFKGKVITMDETLYNRLTDNGQNILDHAFASSLASNGIFANFLSDGLLSTSAYSRVLTDIVSKTEGITNFDQIEGGGIDIYSFTDPSRRLGLTSLTPGRYQAAPATKGVAMNFEYRDQMNTVESIQSYLGIHEWQAHIVHGFIHEDNKVHDPAYGLQRQHSTFPRLRNTNPVLYNEINQRYSNIHSNWR